jgi:hypothetical protein
VKLSENSQIGEKSNANERFPEESLNEPDKAKEWEVERSRFDAFKGIDLMRPESAKPLVSLIQFVWLTGLGCGNRVNVLRGLVSGNRVNVLGGAD